MIIQWVFEGAIVPKARPRVDKRSTHYAENYESWRKNALLLVQQQVWLTPAAISQHFPLSGVRVDFEFHRSLRGNADLENAKGAWLDVLVKGEVIKDDSVGHLTEGGERFFGGKGRKLTFLWIYPDWEPVSIVDPKLLESGNFPNIGKFPTEDKKK